MAFSVIRFLPWPCRWRRQPNAARSRLGSCRPARTGSGPTSPPTEHRSSHDSALARIRMRSALRARGDSGIAHSSSVMRFPPGPERVVAARARSQQGVGYRPSDPIRTPGRHRSRQRLGRPSAAPPATVGEPRAEASIGCQNHARQDCGPSRSTSSRSAVVVPALVTVEPGHDR